MSLDAKLNNIPNFLKAKSPQGLRRLMLLNNVKSVIQYTYHDIQFVNGDWYAWYYEPINIGDLTSGDNNRSGQT
jgi:hypothetical protein